jgi:flagellar biogenesis protein FliO
MKKDELAEILATHADALVEGRDISAQFLAHFPEQSAELSSLFQLASSIRSALTPVSSPDFRSRLQSQLTDYAPSGPITITPTARPKMVWLVAAAGSLLSVAGLAIWALRRFRAPGSSAAQPATSA